MNLDKYTLGQYVEGGRLWPFVDCYGLVLEVRRDLGLPDWPEWSEMRKADGGFARACDEMIQNSVTPCEPGHGVVVAAYRGSVLDHALSGLSWRPQWFYEVQHLSTSLGLVEAGLGVSAMPSLAMPAGDHPTLVSVPLIEPVVNRSLGLVYRRGASLSPAAEKFVSILLEQWPQ